MMTGILEIDTRGICLLCLSSCSKSVSGLSSIQGFEKLLRYLKVNTTELFNCSLQFLQTMQINEDITMGITLCQKCSLVTESFDRLYQQYELIRIQFDNCVQSVMQSIKTGNESPGLASEFNKRMRPQRLNELLNASLANNLRNETFKKCSSKLQSSIPRVSVNKIEKEKLLLMTTPETTPTPSARLSTTGDLKQSNDILHMEHIILDDTNREEYLIENDNEFLDEELEISTNNTFSSSVTIPPYQEIQEQQSIFSGGRGADTRCQICTYSIKSSYLREHMMLMHPNTILSSYFPSNLVCTEQMCTSAMDLLLSQVIVTDTGYKKCPYCTSTTKPWSKLKLHIMVHHPSTFATEVMEYGRQNPTDRMDIDDSGDPLAEDNLGRVIFVVKCDKCNKRFPSGDMLHEHICSQVAKPIKCTICKHRYDSMAQINKHMATVHSNRKFTCPHCTHSTITMSNLNCHIKDVHLVEEVMLQLPLTCRIQCGQVVEGILEELKQSGLNCMHCEFITEKTNRLKRHVVGTHYDKFVNEVKRRLGISAEGEMNMVEEVVKLEPC